MEDTLALPRNDTAPVNDSDDDTPMLSSHALAALKEFLEERNNGATGEAEQREPEDDKEEVSLVSEDWRLSQFWYDAVTAETVAKEAVTISAIAGASSPVACVACPTLYPYIKKLDPSVGVQLLEFDRRFEQFGSDFTFYDYNRPEELPEHLKHAFRVVIADPPYLSKECLEKVSQTIAFLASPGQAYILLLTGEVQRDRAAELLGLYPCGFRPQHSSKLGNEFRLFTNYDPGMRLGGWKLD